jgi:hypothetical protein
MNCIDALIEGWKIYILFPLGTWIVVMLVLVNVLSLGEGWKTEDILSSRLTK